MSVDDVTTLGDRTQGFESSHARTVAPEGMELTKHAAEICGTWTRTLVAVDFPTVLKPGALDKLHTHPSANVDVAIHADPVPRAESIASFEDALDDLERAKIDKEGRKSATRDVTERRLTTHRAVLQALRDGTTRIHKVAVYVTLRAEDRDDLDKLTRRITDDLTGSQITLKEARRKHDHGVVATSPIAADPIGQTTRMTAHALASLLPFSSSTVIEPSGVLFGYHGTTDAPFMPDRYARENGYNMILSGKTGDGKTFGAKLITLRRFVKDPDTLVFFIDPLGDYRRMVDKLGGERVTIGGTRGLNPLDIQPTPETVLTANPDMDPYSMKMSAVSGFFADYFKRNGMSLGFARPVLDLATRTAYERAGITPDPSTHSRPSPTIRDVGDRPSVMGVLYDIEDSPGAFVDNMTDRSIDEYEDAASKLRMGLHPFSEGETYAHLGGTTEIDLFSNRLVYCDIQRSGTSRELGQMMNLVLDAIAQRSRLTDKRVVLGVDEAHNLLENEHSIEWLDVATREARHHDMSLMLATQQIEDFLSSEKRRTIAGNCSIQLHWREEKLSEAHRDALGLTPRQGEFVRNAKPGTPERGYSQALCVVGDTGAYPLKIKALQKEATIIDEDMADYYGVA